MTIEGLDDPLGESRALRARADERKDRECERAAEKAREHSLLQQLGDLQRELAAFESLDDDLRIARDTRERYASEHSTYLANINLAEQHDALAAQVVERQRTLHALHDQVATAEESHRRALAGYDRARHEAVRKQLSDEQRNQAAKLAELAGKERRLKDVLAEISQLRELSLELEVAQGQLAEMAELRQTIELIRDLLKQAGPQIIRQMVRQVSREASSLYGDIMGDHSSRLEWSEDYELTLDVRGRKRSFRQFSGGEQMSAALAVRLALLRQMSNVDVAFFDEPTAHLDPARRESLAEQIMQVKGFSQLFVISHDDSFERHAQNYVRIIKDEQGSHQENASVQ